MKFIPYMSTLLVEKIDIEEQKESLVLLPEESKKPFTIVKVIEVSPDINQVQPNDLLVARTEGLEDIKINNEIFTIVRLSFIVGELYKNET